MDFYFLQQIVTHCARFGTRFFRKYFHNFQVFFLFHFSTQYLSLRVRITLLPRNSASIDWFFSARPVAQNSKDHVFHGTCFDNLRS
jgi:hypothetical protein